MAALGPLSQQTLGGKYLLGELLGQGGFGAVYKAQHLLLNRPQAVKILLEQHFASPKFRERFVREAQTLAALDHTAILPVHDFGIEGNRAFLVMPYIAGGSLQAVLNVRQGPLGLDETRRYLEQICSALDYAHARKVVHLDLKPLNLLIHEDGRLLLSDFGLAHLMEQGALEGGTNLQFGSPLYMAPEHFDGRPEQRSDLYALGVMLYQLLVGHVPFEGATPVAVMRKHLTEPPPSLRAARPDLPLALERVIGKTLAKQPTQRYSTAGELLVDFKAALVWRASPSLSSVVTGPYEPGRISQPPLVPIVHASHPLAPPAVCFAREPAIPINRQPFRSAQFVPPDSIRRAIAFLVGIFGVLTVFAGSIFWLENHHRLGPGLLLVGVFFVFWGAYAIWRQNKRSLSQ